MKQYKHKDGKYIAEYQDMEERHQYKIYSVENGGEEGTLSSTFIEGSNDWDEIKEVKSDWIDEAFNECGSGHNRITVRKEDLREAINKHLPRITDDMIEEMRKELGNGFERDWKYTIKQNLPKDLLANPE